MSNEIPSNQPELAIIGSVDHADVAEQVLDYILAQGVVGENLRIAYDSYDKFGDPLLRAINDLAKFVEPTDEVLGKDPERTIERTVVSGGVTALLVIDQISRQVDLNQDAVRAHTAGFSIRIVDVSKLPEMTQAQRYARIGSGIMDVGAYDFERLPQQYQGFINDVTDVYPEVALNPNVFKTSFGFFLGAGLRSIAALMSVERARNILSEINDFDDELKKLLDEA